MSKIASVALEQGSIDLPSNKTIWKPWLPRLMVLIWLLYLAITIWQHALHSAQTPFGDPLSYMQKAANFWQMIERGMVFNPLNLSPSVRPPGTILMSYPFGLSSDFYGFYFRSVFLPILSIVAAVYIAAGTALERGAGWWVAAIAILFSSLPMFYWFDWNDERWVNMGWGMVDNFQAGIAALASAAVLRSLQEKSQRWLWVAALAAAFTLLVKPSGLMVMAMVALAWLIAVAFEWVRMARIKGPVAALRVYVLGGCARIATVYALVIIACVLSEYFSSGNFEYATSALALWRKVQIDRSYALLLHLSVGEAVILWVFAVWALFGYRLATARAGDELLRASTSGLLVGGILTWILGAWYWLVVQGGGGQIRYAYPFMLMGLICMIPAALQVWPFAHRLVRLFAMALCLLPALNMAALLAAGDDPSGSWQYRSGVSVSVGKDREQVHQAYSFLDAVRKTSKDARVYFFPIGTDPHIFVFVGPYEKMLDPELASFQPANPMDWARGFAVRIDELLDSGYILVRKYPKPDVAASLAAEKFDTFDAELHAFNEWISTLTKSSGVEILSDGRTLRLMRIVDRAALALAIEQFVSAHSWRPEFVEANLTNPAWWNAQALSASGRKPVVEEINFGGVYQLHALSVNRIGKGVKVEAWWEELQHEDANNQRFLFLHLLDSSGAILQNQQIALHPYQPPFENRRWRYGTVTFNGALSNEKLASLAFGIYHAGGVDFLLADWKGQTDWESRRNLIPVADLFSTKDVKAASGLR